MYDHVKPVIRDVSPDNIIIYVRTNDLSSKEISGQIAKSIIYRAVSLKANTNTISIYLVTPLDNHLNNKASEVNSRLANMCEKRHIPVIGHLSYFLYVTLIYPLHKKLSFPLRISSVNVTKSAVSCELDHIY